tara:strand:+ start:256 stop:2496 length:2241 start_codon:yes stop_codon:yes gene_type:complete
MIVKKIFISFISLLILFLFFILIYFSYFDTGIYYSFHYLKSKTIENYRNNQVTLQNMSQYNDMKKESYENEYEPKVGLISKIYAESSFNNIQTYSNQLKEQDIELNKWERSNGGNFSNKFSNFEQLNKLNIKKLDVLWQYNTSNYNFKKNAWKNNVEINPIFYDGIIYFATPYKEIIAVEALTGNLIWKFHSLKKIDARGMLFWLNKKDPKNSCIFVPIKDVVFCINSKTGKRLKSFGNDGYINSGVVRAAPVVWNNKLIVATLDSLKIRAYSLPFGELLWEIPIHPINKNFEGGTPWGGISLDSKRNLLFVSTGNPRPALYGGSRKGDNKNSNSILAFDLINQKIKWSFQEVSHDLWDYDIASPPLLTSMKIAGQIIDVVIVMTKIGNTFIFERENGEPIFNIEYKEAPKSDVKNEKTASKQIYSKLPEPTIKLNFDITDLDTRNLKNRNEILNNMDNYKYGWFEPPSLEKTLLLYGLHGGAQWPGGVYDPSSQNLFIPVNQIPWKIRLYLTSDETHPKDFNIEYKLYEKNCSSCHGKKRNGIYRTQKEKEIIYFPSLIDIYNKKYYSYDEFYSKIKKKHITKFKDSEIKDIYSLFKEWDKKIDSNKSSKINFQWSQFLYDDDLPASKPPWGKIVSINLNNGLLNWEVPNGYVDNKKIGTSNFGGILVTKSGLIFATGTDDNKVVALNSENGNEIWSYEMDSAGSTSPMTFMWKDKQILIVVASGGRYHNYKDKSGTIYAFAIKE